MHNPVTVVDQNINHTILHTEMEQLMQDNHLLGDHWLNQISLSSLSGSNDWSCSVGRMSGLKVSESAYDVLNEYLKGSYTEHIIGRFPQYARWRLMRVQPLAIGYSIHVDKATYDVRLHIPTQTDPECLFTFWDDIPESGKSTTVRTDHLPCGAAYEVDVSRLHTVINLSQTVRYHIVAGKV